MTDLEHCVVNIARFQQAVWDVDRGNFRPGDALAALQAAKVESPGMGLWVNKERTVLVRRYGDGTTEVATREEPGAIWGPPVRVELEAS